MSMSASMGDDGQIDAYEQYWSAEVARRPDDAVTSKMVYESISDERALALRRLADARAQVLDMADLRLAFGARVA